MHQPFVTTAPHPHLWGRVGDSRAKVRGNYFLIVPTVQDNDRVLTLGSIPKGDSVAKGGAKSKVLTSSQSPGGVAYSRALKAEKS